MQWNRSLNSDEYFSEHPVEPNAGSGASLVAELPRGPRGIGQPLLARQRFIHSGRGKRQSQRWTRGGPSSRAVTRCQPGHTGSGCPQAGSPAVAALPPMAKLLTDPAVCLEAALAMAAIDAAQAMAAVPTLTEALVRSKPLEIPAYPAELSAEAIVTALGRIGPPAAAALPIRYYSNPNSAS